MRIFGVPSSFTLSTIIFRLYIVGTQTGSAMASSPRTESKVSRSAVGTSSSSAENIVAVMEWLFRLENSTNVNRTEKTDIIVASLHTQHFWLSPHLTAVIWLLSAFIYWWHNKLFFHLQMMHPSWKAEGHRKCKGDYQCATTPLKGKNSFILL